MADVKGLLADPQFNALDAATQKTVLGRIDPTFSNLSDDDYATFKTRISGPSPRVGGQKVLDYTNDTLSNVPGSAAKLAGNIGHAVMHPYETGRNLLNVATGTMEKMTPDTPSHRGRELVPYADAAGQALKERYGSPSAIANTIRTDPVGAAADASAVAGGVSGLARGTGAIADLANLPRVASGATKVADTAGAVSDVLNPVNAIARPAKALSRATGKGFAKSALSLPGKAERYGATPATAALEQTSGLTPVAVKESAIQRLNDLGAELENMAQHAKATGRTGDLGPARQVIADAIDKIRKYNGDPSDLLPMQKQLTDAQPGFVGKKLPIPTTTGTPAYEIAAQQDPVNLLGIKRQFGDDFTKFDAAIPLRNSTLRTGNQAYHELSSEFNRAVPGADKVNQQIQSLVPVKDAAARVSEHAGPVQTAVNRATRPTGGLAATLFGFHEGGVPGALAAMAMQESLSSPTVKMGVARALYGLGRGTPVVPRALNAAGVASEAEDGSQPPRMAKGGIIKPRVADPFAKGGIATEPTQVNIESLMPPRLGSPSAPMNKKAQRIQKRMANRINARLKR